MTTTLNPASEATADAEYEGPPLPEADGTEAGPAFYGSYRPVSVMHSKDVGESARVGRAVRSWPAGAWHSARKVVLRLRDYAEASYVEGWVVLESGLYVEYAWVARCGVVIDPTLPTGVLAYFPGLEFVGRAGVASFLATPKGKACRRTPFLYAFGWGGWLHPTMRQAQLDAAEYAAARYLDGRRAGDEGFALGQQAAVDLKFDTLGARLAARKRLGA